MALVVARVVTRALPLALALLAACGRGNRYAPPPPPPVTVSRPLEQEVTTYAEFSGHTAAVESADIRARVQGYLQSVEFVPGSAVHKGQLLFVIEPTLYQARVDQAQADLDGKEAQYRAAQEQLEITQAIFRRAAGSRTDLVNKTQQRDLARAQVEGAKATLAAAKLDLSYTHIYAPFDGRIDRNLVDVGNLVGAGEATLLATLVRDDPIYFYFTASESELLRYRELQRENRTAAPAGRPNAAYLALATDVGFPHAGEVDYASNRVDPDTGTIEIRAVFPNPDHIVVPGLFGRVRLPFTRERALLVPEVALAADQGGQYVLTVDDRGAVAYRRVHVGQAVGEGMRIVTDGIGPQDWVIVAGLQRARPGAVVKATRTETKPVPEAPLAR
ncbi:MAG TPA: efflux RND transporter periplasmic adaptor subunit [Candidatus Binatia bacterium]|nr:efflux RND transporter periplasmic adaptor subunit [Candidatus Binatia bacterium]